MEKKINYLIKQYRRKFYFFGKKIGHGEGVELESSLEIISGDHIILEKQEMGFSGLYRVVQGGFWQNVSSHDFFLLVKKVK